MGVEQPLKAQLRMFQRNCATSHVRRTTPAMSSLMRIQGRGLHVPP